jgi:hypothetical protein
MEYYLVLDNDDDCSKLKIFDLINDPDGDSVLFQVTGFAGDGYIMDPIRNAKDYKECSPLAKDLDPEQILEFSHDNY